jgi:hypothetical protein
MTTSRGATGPPGTDRRATSSRRTTLPGPRVAEVRPRGPSPSPMPAPVSDEPAAPGGRWQGDGGARSASWRSGSCSSPSWGSGVVGYRELDGGDDPSRLAPGDGHDRGGRRAGGVVTAAGAARAAGWVRPGGGRHRARRRAGRRGRPARLRPWRLDGRGAVVRPQPPAGGVRPRWRAAAAAVGREPARDRVRRRRVPRRRRALGAPAAGGFPGGGARLCGRGRQPCGTGRDRVPGRGGGGRPRAGRRAPRGAGAGVPTSTDWCGTRRSGGRGSARWRRMRAPSRRPSVAPTSRPSSLRWPPARWATTCSPSRSSPPAAAPATTSTPCGATSSRRSCRRWRPARPQRRPTASGCRS